METALIYLIIINFISFLLSYHDKRAAVHHKRRVPEKNLFIVAIIGGSIGLYSSMLIFRHKTKHASFMLGVPAVLAIQLLITLLFFGCVF